MVSRKRGRPKLYTESETKERRKRLEEDQRRATVYIGDEIYETWVSLKDQLNMKSNVELIRFLIDE